MSSSLHQHEKRASLSDGWGLRLIFLLSMIAALTYYARFRQPEVEVVRTHDLVGWVFPTARGLSVLLVAPDDGIDSNAVATGQRLWISPPRRPALLDAAHVRFGGPGMTVLGDSLELATVKQLCSRIDSAGTLILEGKQLWDSRLLSSACEGRRLVMKEYAQGIHPFDPEVRVFSQDSARSWIAEFSGHRLHFLQNAGNLAVSDTASLLVLMDRLSDHQLSDQNLGRSLRTSGVTIFLASAVEDSIAKENILLSEKDYGAAFRLDQSTGKLLVQKVWLEDWSALAQ